MEDYYSENSDCLYTAVSYSYNDGKLPDQALSCQKTCISSQLYRYARLQSIHGSRQWAPACRSTETQSELDVSSQKPTEPATGCQQAHSKEIFLRNWDVIARCPYCKSVTCKIYWAITEHLNRVGCASLCSGHLLKVTDPFSSSICFKGFSVQKAFYTAEH